MLHSPNSLERVRKISLNQLVINVVLNGNVIKMFYQANSQRSTSRQLYLETLL